jgi:hypothetical protein
VADITAAGSVLGQPPAPTPGRRHRRVKYNPPATRPARLRRQ